MLIFSEKQVKQALQDASSSIKDALYSPQTSESLKRIYSRYNVDEETGRKVTADIGLVLVGLVPVKKFISAIQEDTGLDKEKAKNIAHDVREEIFAPVADELAQIQVGAQRKWEEAERQPTTDNRQQTTDNPQQTTDNKQPATDNQQATSGQPNEEKPGPDDESVIREHTDGEESSPEADTPTNENKSETQESQKKPSEKNPPSGTPPENLPTENTDKKEGEGEKKNDSESSKNAPFRSAPTDDTVDLRNNN